jgi:hypothetical protein
MPQTITSQEAVLVQNLEVMLLKMFFSAEEAR